jgi:hypothetical protein
MLKPRIQERQEWVLRLTPEYGSSRGERHVPRERMGTQAGPQRADSAGTNGMGAVCIQSQAETQARKPAGGGERADGFLRLQRAAEKGLRGRLTVSGSETGLRPPA